MDLDELLTSWNVFEVLKEEVQTVINGESEGDEDIPKVVAQDEEEDSDILVFENNTKIGAEEAVEVDPSQPIKAVSDTKQDRISETEEEKSEEKIDESEAEKTEDGNDTSTNAKTLDNNNAGASEVNSKMQPFRETLSEFEMLAKVSKCIRELLWKKMEPIGPDIEI